MGVLALRDIDHEAEQEQEVKPPKDDEQGEGDPSRYPSERRTDECRDRFAPHRELFFIDEVEPVPEQDRYHQPTDEDEGETGQKVSF